MKKFLSIILAVVAVFALALTGCNNKVDGSDDKPVIRLRSEAEQHLKVGDSMEIVYSLYNTQTKDVTFASDNEAVVTVDRFGNVDAVGVGGAKVTLSLVEDESVYVTLSYTVTKNFFMTDNAHLNGTADLSGQDLGEAIRINGGQSQVLVNDAGEEWYFKTHLEHNGHIGDQGGAWGLGSFLVDSLNKLGNVMFWYEFRYQNDANHARLAYGGYRFDNTLVGSDGHYSKLVSEEIIDISNGVDVTIYRTGVTHYFMLEYSENGQTKTIKHTYDVAFFAGKTTYPGIYGQNQKLTATNYASSNSNAVVSEKLKAFQKAEQIQINAIDTRLVAGKTYNLTTSVSPDYTTDRDITYTLKSPLDGVSLTADGVLTVEAGATGEITVVATATNAPTVTDEQTYEIIAPIASTSEIFDTGMKIGNVSFTQNGLTSSGKAYAPIICNAESWYFTATFATAQDGRFGVMATTDGYTDYFAYGVDSAVNKKTCAVYYGDFGKTEKTVSAVANGVIAGKGENVLAVLKNGSDVYLFINGKQIKKFTTGVSGKLTPVIYSEGANLTVTAVELKCDAEEIGALVAQNAFSVGRRVVVDNGAYVLTNETITGAGDINWPPVNDYENGLKYNQSLKGGFAVEFKMSEINVLPLDKIDSKVLVYLKSEATTCSIQFVFKDRDNDGKVECRMCINLNDASWTEHEIPAELEEKILSGEVTVKVEKLATGVKLWIDGTELYAGEDFMRNFNYWTADTVATPGIGSYNCGVKISDVALTK